jgi:hypothetical protein
VWAISTSISSIYVGNFFGGINGGINLIIKNKALTIN